MRGFQGFTLEFRLGYESAYELYSSWSLEKLRAEVSAREKMPAPEDMAHRGELKAFQDLLLLKEFQALSVSQQDAKCNLVRQSKVRDDETRVIGWTCARKSKTER